MFGVVDQPIRVLPAIKNTGAARDVEVRAWALLFDLGDDAAEWPVIQLRPDGALLLRFVNGTAHLHIWVRDPGFGTWEWMQGRRVMQGKMRIGARRGFDMAKLRNGLRLFFQ